jgi:hypothetical protein
MVISAVHLQLVPGFSIGSNLHPPGDMELAFDCQGQLFLPTLASPALLLIFYQIPSDENS